jgi:hypothetical protein
MELVGVECDFAFTLAQWDKVGILSAQKRLGANAPPAKRLISGVGGNLV